MTGEYRCDADAYFADTALARHDYRRPLMPRRGSQYRRALCQYISRRYMPLERRCHFSFNVKHADAIKCTRVDVSRHDYDYDEEDADAASRLSRFGNFSLLKSYKRRQLLHAI